MHIIGFYSTANVEMCEFFLLFLFFSFILFHFAHLQRGHLKSWHDTKCYCFNLKVFLSKKGGKPPHMPIIGFNFTANVKMGESIFICHFLCGFSDWRIIPPSCRVSVLMGLQIFHMALNTERIYKNDF